MNSSRPNNSKDDNNTPIRIHKWLAKCGIASRREAERWIIAKRVRINGKECKLGEWIVPCSDVIEVDGHNISSHSKMPGHLLLLYKPRGYLVSRRSQGGNPTIYDLKALQKYGSNISPQTPHHDPHMAPYGLPAVGRLDRESEGLLLLTDDGSLSHRLTHPSFNHIKEYFVCVNQPFSQKEMVIMTTGVPLSDGLLINITIKAIQPSHDPWNFRKSSPPQGHCYAITVQEGRKHVIRRLCGHFNKHVLRLIRLKMADYILPVSLKPGHIQILSTPRISQDLTPQPSNSPASHH
ncbi:MAG: pseudouridine synthase [Proteobacteria bacterium]|nr:pseudouridine synthase [Pseudomonadota bacterium]